MRGRETERKKAWEMYDDAGKSEESRMAERACTGLCPLHVPRLGAWLNRELGYGQFEKVKKGDVWNGWTCDGENRGSFHDLDRACGRMRCEQDEDYFF